MGCLSSDSTLSFKKRVAFSGVASLKVVRESTLCQKRGRKPVFVLFVKIRMPCLSFVTPRRL